MKDIYISMIISVHYKVIEYKEILRLNVEFPSGSSKY